MACRTTVATPVILGCCKKEKEKETRKRQAPFSPKVFSIGTGGYQVHGKQLGPMDTFVPFLFIVGIGFGGYYMVRNWMGYAYSDDDEFDAATGQKTRIRHGDL